MHHLTRLVFLLGLVACQQPFGSDRHDLAGFRILALTTSPQGSIPGDVIVPSAHFVTADTLWSDDVVHQYWFWTEDLRPDAVWALKPTDAIEVGPQPSLTRPNREAALVLIAIDTVGDERRAVLSMPSERMQPAPQGELLLFSTGQKVQDQTVETLNINNRQNWDVVASSSVPANEIARFEVYHSEKAAQSQKIRWMATGEFGTFFETTLTATDWVPAQMTVEDDELIVTHSVSEGVRTVAALLLDEASPRAVLYREVWLGEPKPGVWFNGHRWIGHTTNITTPGYYQVVFAADDDSPSGLRLESASPIVFEAPPKDDPYGTLGLNCETQVSGPFDPTWLTLNWCLRSQVVGHPMVVEVKP